MKSLIILTLSGVQVYKCRQESNNAFQKKDDIHIVGTNECPNLGQLDYVSLHEILSMYIYIYTKAIFWEEKQIVFHVMVFSFLFMWKGVVLYL